MVLDGNPSINGPEWKQEVYTVEDSGLQRASSFDAVSLSWHHLSVFVRPKEGRFSVCRGAPDTGQRKQLLRDVSGVAEPGHLLAIMGASGAGKTTLLNVLTGRNVRLLQVEGEVALNGRKVGKRDMSAVSAYVQQEDLFIGTLKVREHLVFQALLRMDRGISFEDRMRRVEEVIVELGLSRCADTVIGVVGRVKGISGGEAKRLAFAAEVLTHPALLFCDEPTSGLDSFMAQSVVSVLREMAAGGRTVVCTVHQPSSETFALFDHLLLLAEGGRVAYRGRAEDALPFFERIGLRCPINYNPADFYIHNLAIIPGKETETKEKVSVICDQFAREFNELENSSSNVLVDCVLQTSTKYKTSWCVQFRALLWRSWISMIREPMTTKVRFMQSVVLALVLGVAFLGQKVDEKGIMNINGALFILLMNTTFSNMMTVINTFTLEQPIFLREHWNGMYRTDAYFLSKTLAEAPILAASTVLFTCILYWMVGFNKDYKAFLICIVILVLVANTSASFGYMVSCMSSSLNVALSISVPLLMPLVLFGGFYINAGSIPVYFIWLKYISWIFYGNEAILINQWRDVTNITCSSNRCPNNGTEILENLNFKEENLGMDIGLIVVLFLVFRIIAFLALLRKSSKKT